MLSENNASDLAAIASSRLSFAFNCIGCTSAQAAESFRMAFAALAEYEPLWDDTVIKAVATPRQWHLYTKGKPRVSKKWENALLRKARIAEKRRNSCG